MTTDGHNSLIAEALGQPLVHPRIHEQTLVGENADLSTLIAAVPRLRAFGDHHYAGVRAALDWDHQLPSEFALLRIYMAYEAEGLRHLDVQIQARTETIQRDNIYPEFDLPDYADLEADESYVGVVRPGNKDFEEFRFFAPWRKNVHAPTAQRAMKVIKKTESYVRAYRERANDALGSALVIGWAPPCLAKSENWAVEVWLVVDFDGQHGKAKVFMVDSETMVVTHEYDTDVHVA